ncbi:hypothetical protein K492DRAFT_130234 [Lichtheimia hyalospora FSU 10163]|nr:hypothetical protein K492DRAFT_130234 [Lichtheimia hyalospora FSU 10163]
MRFTPTDRPKKPLVEDTAKKIHVKFNNDDNEPKVENKKRSSSDQTIDHQPKKQKTTNGNKTGKEGRKAVQITVPGASSPKPNNKNNKRPVNKGTPKKKTMSLEDVRAIREKKRERRRAQKQVGDVKVHVPSLKFNTEKINDKLKVDDIRNFLIYALADTTAPEFATMINRGSLEHVVLLYVPGLDASHFGLPQLDNYSNYSPKTTPHFIDIKSSNPKLLGRITMPYFSSVFPHALISALPAKRHNVGLEFMETLQCPVSNKEKARRQEQLKQRMEKYKDRLEEYYMFTLEEMRKCRYPIPTCLDPTSKLPDDEWKETRPAATPSERKRLMALDCEMVKTTAGKALARVTLVDENGESLLDQFVKPEEPILDYLTEYSGITPEIMQETTCSLRRAQKYVRRLVDHNVILVGHSMENDLQALKIAHPYCVDTALLYDGFRGPPHKPALRYLTSRFLKRQIQHHGKVGHDSGEDARAAMDLFKLKMERGPQFGKSKTDMELLFNRLDQATKKRSSVLLERNATPTYLMSNMYPATYQCCSTDEELVQQTVEASKKYNLVVSQFRTLKPTVVLEEAAVPTVLSSDSSSKNNQAATRMELFDRYFREMYQGFPEGTLVFVMGGYGGIDDEFPK